LSKEQKLFLNKYRRNKKLVLFIQVFIVIFLIVLWEFLSINNIINSFIFSSPSKVFKTVYNLYLSNDLFKHIFITLYETLVAFGIGMLISIVLSTLLYLYEPLYKILDPFITGLNSLPKVALGPMIIIVAGANVKSVILMAVLINVIVSTVVITNGFYNTDKVRLKLLKSFKATKLQILRYLVIPSSFNTIISSFKLSISMSLIGVISGEFLTSSAGIGYLIIYGTQVFNLDLVVSGIVILILLSSLLYFVVLKIEKLLIKKRTI
jgi:NitT/TauT family transport system permease protein